MAKSFLLSNGKFVRLGTGGGFGNAIHYHPVGGKIFYDNGSNGASYTFYDANGNVIPYSGTNPAVALSNAVTYVVSGVPAKDRFYVYDNIGGLKTGYYWGAYGTNLNITGESIGSGKINTQTVFNSGIPTDRTPNIWSYAKQCRNGKLNGCSDWFIASKAEQDKLRESGLVDWYSSNDIWSSTEYNSSDSWIWVHSKTLGSPWSATCKLDQDCCFVCRSF